MPVLKPAPAMRSFQTGSRRIGGLHGPVLEGMALVVAQARPDVAGHALDEDVVVVAGLGDQGQDLAAGRVHGHDGPGLAVEQP